ncbi:helix-turn-helix transcriptional regulator [Sulfuriferula thiophila]|uniref:helix-turn-helix transcriptional regulator n=1 Tax=Sulfuriferula thiophila TaxID=1781211 RepID=UPI000F60E025|nr:AlpA family phage regulatory protein [Sulfuriferula thiophila]
MSALLSKLLKTNDVLNEFHLSKSTLFRLIKSGQFPAPIKIGGGCFWKADELEAFLNKKTGSAA